MTESVCGQHGLFCRLPFIRGNAVRFREARMFRQQPIETFVCDVAKKTIKFTRHTKTAAASDSQQL